MTYGVAASPKLSSTTEDKLNELSLSSKSSRTSTTKPQRELFSEAPRRKKDQRDSLSPRDVTEAEGEFTLISFPCH